MKGAERQIRVPLPPSANALRIVCKGRLITSPKYRAWQGEAEAKAMQESESDPVQFLDNEPLEAFIVLQFKTRAGDLDNRIKPLLDLCENINVFGNDRQIVKISAFRGPSADLPEARVTIREWWG